MPTGWQLWCLQTLEESLNRASDAECSRFYTANPLSKSDARSYGNGNKLFLLKTAVSTSQPVCAVQPINSADKLRHLLLPCNNRFP